MQTRYSYSLIFSFLLLCAVNSYSQQTLNTQVVAKRSYGMYLKQQWPELIAYGDSVLKLGYDYYYIRMRMGIAYYELQKYRLAETHFKKAIEFNASEDMAYEYLYYIYVFTDRFEESRKLISKMSGVLKSKIKTDSLPAIDAVFAEGGGKVSSYTNVPNAAIFELGLNHYVANKFSILHTYTYYGQGNSYWQINQNQYYLNVNFPLKNKFMLSGAFHYLDRSTTISSSTVKGYNYVESMSLKKSFNYFDASVGSTALWLDSVFQFQHNASLTYFPLANNKLGIGANVYLYTQNAYSSLNLAYVPFVSFKPIPKLSLFASYFINTGKNNIAEWNGYLVNNSPDLTTSRLTLSADYIINRRFDVFATYQFENKQSTYYSTDYQYNSFFIGLKFKP
jgi:tetratricopeptide (TPR) repeat protein